MKSGIYAIYNDKSGKGYIGQSKDVYRRKEDHWRALRKGKHHNKYLQRAFDCDGEEHFHFKIMELCPVEELDKKEREYIARMQLMDNALGYNLEGGGNCGKEVSEKVREAKRGSNNPMYGKHISEEHIELLRIKNRGHGSALSEKQVEQIKVFLSEDTKSEKELAEMFNVSRAVICKIKTAKNWNWVRSDLNEVISDEYKKKIRNEKIITLYSNGETRASIAKILDIEPATVARVLGTRSEFFRDSEVKQELKRNVVHDFQSGLSKQEIMKKYDINSCMYVRLTHEAYNEKQKLLKEKAIEMRKSGMMVKDISKALGFARTTISKWTVSVR